MQPLSTAKISLKNKIILSTSVLLVILATIIFFIIKPAMNEILKISKEIEMQREDLERKYQRGQSLKKLTEDLKVIEPQLEKLDELFIKRDESLKIITSLEKIAENNGVEQKINLSAQGTKISDYQKIPIQIFSRGNFFNQTKYLTSLEKLNTYININLIEFTGNNTNPEELSMLIFGDTYWK
jgi:Tfp pilus assembly protein PilO